MYVAAIGRVEEIIWLPYDAGLSTAALDILCESLREWLLVPPFTRAFLKSPSSRGLSAIAELLVQLLDVIRFFLYVSLIKYHVLTWAQNRAQWTSVEEKILFVKRSQSDVECWCWDVTLVQVMETENSYYLVTELCGGGDLMSRICSRKRLDELETRRYIRQIISAVDYLHKAGIIHRSVGLSVCLSLCMS